MRLCSFKLQAPDVLFELHNVSRRSDPDVKGQLKPDGRFSVRKKGDGLTNVLVWNNIGLDSSIDYGEVDSGDISKCLVRVRL